MHDEWVCFYLHGRHLYASSMNLVVSGHGSLFIVRDDAKNLQCLFFWQASTTICNSAYWKESREWGEKISRHERKKIIYTRTDRYISLQENKENEEEEQKKSQETF